MTSKEYFLTCLGMGNYALREWVLSVFSLTKPTKNQYPHKLQVVDMKWGFKNENGELVVIEDSDSSRPLLTFLDQLNLKAGDLPNLQEDVTTTVGQVFANVYILTHTFKDRIPYQNGPFDLGKIEKFISKNLTTDDQYRKEGDFVGDPAIYVSEYLQFIDCTLALEGFSQLCVPSVSPRSLTTDPRIAKRRAELLELHKDSLTDPTVIAAIEAELVQMDKDWLKGDIAEGFYFKGKQWVEARKKSYIMFGLQQGLGSDPVLIKKNLNEGWDADNIPGMVNALREGSYGRGKGTALGGAETKIVNRMFQNVKVAEEDCGSTLGWDVEMTEANLDKYTGYYYISSAGPTLINDSNRSSLKGKTLTVRSPQFCKTEGVKFCKCCMGNPNSENENALAAYAAEITSTLMGIQMKKMHFSALQNTKIDLARSIS